ncbi:uncharacterized protein LOC131239305 [Magnolia sinica]|uniref:uncharacterized protein LOC131239305 n=1 Tax=Magnolia sinica TaxID=86752 RepID=UPI002659A9CD|nr:uncharacterized protein LOC131239305 [Magnolia sinica]
MSRAIGQMGLFSKRLILLLVLYLCADKGEAMGYGKPATCESLECPAYEVVDQQKEFEVRSYKNAVWMSTSLINATSYKEAAGMGFNMLFAYIQGKNNQGLKINMTAPVRVDILPSTGPLYNSSFTVHFYVPQNYQNDPPLAENVHPEGWPKQHYAAVRRFGGFLNDSSILIQASSLKKSLQGTPWESVVVTSDGGPSIYTVAGYNSPFESENRVNEVMLLFDKF